MTAQLRLFILLIFVALTLAACTSEENSDESPTHAAEDVGTSSPTPDTTNPDTTNPDTTNPDATNPDHTEPDNTYPPFDPCYSIHEAGTCLADTAIWCAGSANTGPTGVRTLVCSDMGGTGCNAGVCTGIPRGYDCDDRRECAHGLICRRGVCTTSAPGELITRTMGNGRVWSPSLGIDCSDHCPAYGPGFMEITLHAEPAEGSVFTEWSRDCSGDSPTTQITFVSEYRRVCIANFERFMATVQTVARHNAGSIKSEPAGIDCPDNCRALFELDQPVTLTAVAKPGFAFNEWFGCVESDEPTVTFTANQEHLCVADFQKQLDLSVAVTGPGKVTSEQADIDCPGTCNAVILSGQHYPLTAIPNDGARFVQWEGHCSGQSESTTLHISNIDQQPFPDLIECNAVFEDIPLYPVTVSIIGDGQVTSDPVGIDCPDVSCSANFPEDTYVTLRPSVAPDSKFMDWIQLSADHKPNPDTNYERILNVRMHMQKARSYLAEFAAIPTLTQTWQHARLPHNASQVEWNLDGTQFAASNNNSIRVFDAETGEFLQHMVADFATDMNPGPFTWNSFGSSATYDLAFAGTTKFPSGNQQHRIYHFKAGMYSKLFEIPAPVTHLTFDLHRTTLAGATADGTIYLWNPQTPHLIQSWPAHNGPITALAFAPNGHYLASSSTSDNTRIWTRTDWEMAREFTAPGWNSLDWTHNSQEIAGTTHDQIHVWNVDGTPIASWPATDCKSVSFAPDRTKLVATCDSKITVWDITNQSLLYTVPPIGTTNVQSTRWNPALDKILAHYDDHSVRIFSSVDGELLTTFPFSTNTNAAINHLAYSPHTNQLYAANDDGRVFSLNPADGKIVDDFNIPTLNTGVASIALSPSGETLLAAQGSYIYEWSTLTGASAHPPWNAGGPIAHISLSDDDILAISLTDSAVIRMWPTRGQPHTSTLTNPQPAPHIAWQPGTGLLASTADQTISLWNPETSTIEHTADCIQNRKATHPTFSPDGRYLAVICADTQHKRLLILDTTNLSPPQNHPIALEHITGRPATNTIATIQITAPLGKKQNTLQFYHIRGYHLTNHPLLPTPGTITALTWSTDGHQLFIATSTGTITALDTRF